MEGPAVELPSRSKRVADLALTFLKFGCFTFGGGWSIIAQIKQEYVEKRHWITDEELLDFTSVGRSLPGLMIGNVSILFGYRIAGVPGALVSLFGIVFPPFLVMILVTALYSLFSSNVYVAYAMRGVRAAVAPIILNALLGLTRSGLKDILCYVIAAAAFALCVFTGVSNVVIILLCATVGLIIQWRKCE